MKKYLLILIFIIITAVHFIAQNFACGFAPGNTAFKQTGVTFYGVAWGILSFPIFWFAPRGDSNLYVWIMFSCNSIIWGLGLTFLISLLFKNKVILPR